MNNAQDSLRNWHPIEEAIIEHVDRYGITTPKAAWAAGVRGMNNLQVAEARLHALTRRGDLVTLSLPGNCVTYTLSLQSRQRLGQQAAERLSRPPSLRLLAERFAFLTFSCLQDQRRSKLTPVELKERFADLYRHGSAHHFYLTREFGPPRLGFLRIDVGSYGRWDRIIAKASGDLRTHLSMTLVRKLIDEGAFELTVLTALPTKAQKIEQALTERRDALPVPTRCIAIPELVNFIRPAPD
jgi:hypothetical protein